MEEVTYKLKSGNSLLVVSAVEKLLAGVRSDGATESESLRVLRECCSSAEPAVALAACQGLMTLAETGALSPAHTMSSMLAMLPTAKNYTAIISTITGLLTLELRSPPADYRSRFTLKSPQHPLVTVLEKTPGTEDAVLGQVQAVCCHPHCTISENSLELLRPVFFWFLCHPDEERSFDRRAACWRLLLSLHTKGQMALIMECLLWQRVSTAKSLEATFLMYSTLTDLMFVQKRMDYVVALIPALARISNHFIQQGSDPRPCYNTIDRCFSQRPEELKPCVGLTLTLLAENSLKSPAIYLHSMYALCYKLVTEYEVPSISLSILVAYSLQWLNTPSHLTSEALKVIEKLLLMHQARKTSNGDSQMSSLLKNHLFNELTHTDSKLHLTFDNFSRWEKIETDNEKITWLQDLIDNPHKKHTAKMIPFMYGMMLEETDVDVFAKALNALSILQQSGCSTKDNNDLTVSTLPVLLYKLAQSTSPKIHLECLKAMPKMARLKPNVPSVVAILNKIKSSRGVPASLLLRLFTDLVGVQTRCYPYLQELLLDTTKSDELKWELDIAKAEAVRTICETRASIYGAELVSVISGILNRCSDQSGSIASSLALEALGYLWTERIVSPASTWQALAPRMTRDKRPGVQISLCKLLSEVPNLQSQTLENDKFVSDVSRLLWKYIADSNYPEVIVAACDSLANFKLENYTLKDIPEIYRQGIKLPASFCKTPIDAARKPEDVLDYIPAEVWPNVLKNTNQSGLVGVENLVSAYMEHEMKGYRSGVYQPETRGRLEPDSLGYLPPHSVVRGVMEFVRKQALTPAYDCPDSVLLSAMLCLTRPLSRPLPPLDMCFVHELFHRGEHLRRPSILLATRQALVSPSAKRFVENYLQNLEPDENKEEEMNDFFDMLPALCRTIPPSVVRNVIHKYLSYSYNQLQSVNAKRMNKEDIDSLMFVSQLRMITECINDDKIHEANRTLLSQIVEGYWDCIPDDSVIWEAYEIACSALSTKYLERMTSPSSWWETTSSAIRRATLVRSRLARSRETETPLVWLNDIIGVAVQCPSEHMFVLDCIAIPLSEAPVDDSSMDWLLQLMARVQITIADSPDDVFGLSFLCDVLILSVILLSGWSRPGANQKTKLRLFPSAVADLMTEWDSCSVQMTEWLQHTRNVTNLPERYKITFSRALVALKHCSYFAKPSTWTRVLSVRQPC